MDLNSIEKSADDVYDSIKIDIKGADQLTLLDMERDLRSKIFKLARWCYSEFDHFCYDN